MRAHRVVSRIPVWGASAALVACSLLVTTDPPEATAAGAFTVNTTVDAPDASPGNGVCAAVGGACTLRAAVQEAGRTSAATTITLPAGRYVLSAASPNNVVVGSKALEFASTITLVGAGAATTAIVAGANSRVLDVQRFVPGRAVDATVSGVTLTGGTAALGAGVFTGRDANLTLTDVTISENIAAGSSSQGGGIFAYGEAGYSSRLVLSRVTISGNSAWQGGGMVVMHPVQVTMTDSLIRGNTARGPYGGGVRTSGTMTLTDTTIAGNVAGASITTGAPGGGGVYTGNPPSPGTGQRSTFTMTRGSIANNRLSMSLESSGGGLLNELGGTATLDNVTISGNSAFTGGGVLNDEGTLVLWRAAVWGNTAVYGGGVYNNDFNPSNAYPASATVDRSFVGRNTATDHQCPTWLIPPGNLCGAGGGIFSENARTTVVNSTVAENQASTFGGGLYNLRLGTASAAQGAMQLTNATVSANHAGTEGGGVLVNGAPLTATNTVLADNHAATGPADCFLVPGSAIASTGNSVTTDSRCRFLQPTDRISTALLAPLPATVTAASTMPPIIGSTAIGNASSAVCAASPVAAVDQIGAVRPQGVGCDIGAAEASVAPPGPSSTGRPAVFRSGAFRTRPTQASGAATTVTSLGLAADTPLMCDFDGDGTRSVTVVRPHLSGGLVWFNRPTNLGAATPTSWLFGAATDTPVCGDWDGDGDDAPGVLRNAGGARLWIQSNTSNGSGPLTMFLFGAASDGPMYGDWDGNGTVTPGIVRPVGVAMLWSIRNQNSTGVTEGEFMFGLGTDTPVVGDWDGDGADSPGVVRVEGGSLRWWTRNTIVNGAATGTFLYGVPGDRPLVWTGTGVGGR